MRFHPKLVEQLLAHIDKFISEYAMNTTGMTIKTEAFLHRQAVKDQQAIIDWAHNIISYEAAKL